MEQPQKESVLFICYYFPPMGMGGTQRAAKFAKYLPYWGWRPIVITVKDVHYYAHDDSLLKELNHIPIIRTESWDPLRILARLRTKKEEKVQQKSSSKKLNLLNTLIGGWLLIPDSKILWLPFAIIKALRYIRRYKIKVIYTTSPPHSAHIAGVILKTMVSVKWIADFRDDWTGGESQPCPTFFHSFVNRLLEKIVLKKADQIVGMCDHLTNVLRKKAGTLKDKFSTIMNGYDAEDFYPVLNTSLQKKFTITHCGSVSRVSNPEAFLSAVKQQDDDFFRQAQVQFVGIDIYGTLEKLVRKYQLQHLVAPIEYLPHEQALKRIMSSHLLLITILKKTDEEIITGKIFEYLASGKPILLVTNRAGYVARTIEQLQRGIVVNSKNITAVKDAISYYFSLFKKDKYIFREPLSVPQFDRKNLAGELAEIINHLTV